MTHGTHDLRCIVDASALEVYITSLKLRLGRVNHLLANHEHFVDSPMSSATLLHVLNNIFIVFLGCGWLDLEKFCNADRAASSLDLHCWEGKHTSCCWHASAGSTSDSTHWTRCIVRPLQGDWDTQDHHSIELQGSV